MSLALADFKPTADDYKKTTTTSTMNQTNNKTDARVYLKSLKKTALKLSLYAKNCRQTQAIQMKQIL